MYGADEAGECDLLEFVVDEVADGVGEGEAGGTGGQGGPVDVDGHLHFTCFFDVFAVFVFGEGGINVRYLVSYLA